VTAGPDRAKAFTRVDKSVIIVSPRLLLASIALNRAVGRFCRRDFGAALAAAFAGAAGAGCTGGTASTGAGFMGVEANRGEGLTGT
jgi:hypothetical protein